MVGVCASEANVQQHNCRVNREVHLRQAAQRITWFSRAFIPACGWCQPCLTTSSTRVRHACQTTAAQLMHECAAPRKGSCCVHAGCSGCVFTPCRSTVRSGEIPSRLQTLSQMASEWNMCKELVQTGDELQRQPSPTRQRRPDLRAPPPAAAPSVPPLLPACRPAPCAGSIWPTASPNHFGAPRTASAARCARRAAAAPRRRALRYSREYHLQGFGVDLQSIASHWLK